MRINLLSSQHLTDEFIEVFKAIVKKDFAGVITGLDEFVPGDIPTGPVLALGPTTWQGTYTQGPTVKQVVRTAGGATKLTHALRLATEHTIFEPLATNGYLHLTKPQDAVDMLSFFVDVDEIVVDIETSGDINEDVPSGDAVIMIGFYDGQNEPVVISDEALLDSRVRELVAKVCNSTGETIMWNGKFDTKWLSLYCGRKVSFTFDPMLLHYVMFPGAGEHGLKQVAANYLGAPDWDAKLKNYTTGKRGFENIPTDVLAYYNAQDVYYTYGVYRLLRDSANKRELGLFTSLIMRASHVLQEIEDAGFAIDMPYLEQLGAELEGERARVLSTLHELTAEVDFRSATDMKRKKPIPKEAKPFNPKSPMQVKKYLEETLGRTVYKTDEKTINRMLEKGEAVEFIEALLEHRKLSKIIDTYVNGLLRRSRGGRVYSTFKLHGTITGRLSSSNPNIQNIPRDDRIRRAFISEPYTPLVLVGCDYSQAELRTMAELSGDPAMIDAFQIGAPDFFDALMPSAYPYKDPETFEHDHPEYKENRAAIKGVVYGTSYGRKAAAIAAALGISYIEACGIIDGYLGRFPIFAEWRDNIMPQVTSGTLITPFGRRYQQDVITKAMLVPIENSALSFLPQSTASDICLSAAMDLHTKLKPEQKIVALVHDAITVECPEPQAEGVLALMQQQMQSAATKVFNRVPFLTEGAISTRWNEV